MRHPHPSSPSRASLVDAHVLEVEVHAAEARGRRASRNGLREMPGASSGTRNAVIERSAAGTFDAREHQRQVRQFGVCHPDLCDRTAPSRCRPVAPSCAGCARPSPRRPRRARTRRASRPLTSGRSQRARCSVVPDSTIGSATSELLTARITATVALVGGHGFDRQCVGRRSRAHRRPTRAGTVTPSETERRGLGHERHADTRAVRSISAASGSTRSRANAAARSTNACWSRRRARNPSGPRA